MQCRSWSILSAALLAHSPVAGDTPVWDREALAGDLFGVRSALADLGLEVSGEYVGEY